MMNEHKLTTESDNPALKHEENLRFLSQKIDKHYQEGMFIYSETINMHTIKIEELKNQIASLLKKKEKEELILLNMEQNIGYEGRLLEKLNETFFQKIYSIDELKTQYAHMIEASEYAKILERKESELRLSLDEIEELEITLAQQELERINLLMELSPKRNAIMELEDNLKKIELEKESFASKKLHQIPQLAFEKNEEIAVEAIENNNNEH
jgi:hypothetical protein